VKYFPIIQDYAPGYKQKNLSTGDLASVHSFELFFTKLSEKNIKRRDKLIIMC
jgi:hypothetical protein